MVSYLGRGGTCHAIQATRLADGVPVVFKVVRPDFRTTLHKVRRVRREAQLMRRLSHPHLMPCIDSGEADGWTYLVMPWHGGATLASEVKRRGGLSLSEGLAVGAALLGALDHLHENQVIHRDLKLSNVVLDQDGGAILTDLGLALVPERRRLPRPGAEVKPIGTRRYRAPEQETRPHDVDPRADVYGFGVVLYRALTRKWLRRNDDGSARIDAQIPTAIARVIARCTALEPADRYPTAVAVLEALPARGSRRR